MTQPHSASIFETTQWSAIVAASGDDKALQSLLDGYWGAIYAFIRRCGRPQDEAADLTQEFITHVVLERGLIAKADPDRGRFRTFLKAAVRHFLIDQHRRAGAKGRSPSRPVLGGRALEAMEPQCEDDPSDAFDRQWAASLLSMTLDRVRVDCESAGQGAHWAAFRRGVIDPALGHSRAPSLDHLAAELGIDSAATLSSMMQTVRRKFRRTLAATVQETLADPGELDDELARLRQFLGL